MSVHTNCYFSNSVTSWLCDIRQEVHYYEFDKQIQINFLAEMTSDDRESDYVNIWECLGENNGKNSDAKNSSLESLEHLSENSNYLSENSDPSLRESVSENNLCYCPEKQGCLQQSTKLETDIGKSAKTNIDNEQTSVLLTREEDNKMITWSTPDIRINSSLCAAAECFQYNSLPVLAQCENDDSSHENSVEFVSIDTIDNVSDYTDKNQNSNYLESIESLIDNLFDFEEINSFEDNDFVSVKSELGSIENASENDEKTSYVFKTNADEQLLDIFHTNAEYFVKLRNKYHSKKPMYAEKILKTYSLPNINQSFISLRKSQVDLKSYRHAQIILETPSFTIKSTKDLTDSNENHNLNYAKENSVSAVFEKESVLTLDSLDVVNENVEVTVEEEFVEFLKEDIVFWIREELRYACEEEEDFVVMEQQELLRSIHQPPCRSDPPPVSKFPISDDNVLDIRQKSASRINRCSNSVDWGKTQLISQQHDTKNFEIRGLVKFQLPDQCIITKLNQDYIVYENGCFYKTSTKRTSRDLLRTHVIIKSVRYLNKNKEVQLVDNQGLTYVVYFDSPKYAKHFLDHDVIQGYVEENSANSNTVKKRLLNFLGGRLLTEDLEKIGLLKNGPIFGNSLSAIFEKGGARFINRVIELIESQENIKSLGLYRTSGNQSVIQKIRFQVDIGKLDILDQYKRDPDVLTGSLKMFFRELKEPLVPVEVCDQLIGLADKDPLKLTSQEVEKITSVLRRNLDDSHRQTLIILVRHLIEIVKNKTHNKMDVHNLSICWAPSIVFTVANSPIEMANSFDLVTQSHEAMRFVEFLLGFYMTYPEELDALGKETEHVILSCTRPQNNSSKESLDSSYSQKSKSASNQSLTIDDIVKKLVDIIETNLACEGLYTKTISSDKANKILKKLTKRKDPDIDKNKVETAEVGEALKKYLRDSQEWLVTKDVFEKVLNASKDYHGLFLDPHTREKVSTAIENLPKKDTFIFLIRHLAKLTEDKNLPKVRREELYQAWTKVLNHQQRLAPSDENVVKFLQVTVKIFDPNFNNNLPDLVPNAEFLKDLISEQRARKASVSKKRTQRTSESDRYSRYDNVDDFDVGEAQILDEDDGEQKTEDTKL